GRPITGTSSRPAPPVLAETPRLLRQPQECERVGAGDLSGQALPLLVGKDGVEHRPFTRLQPGDAVADVHQVAPSVEGGAIERASAAFRSDPAESRVVKLDAEGGADCRAIGAIGEPGVERHGDAPRIMGELLSEVA